MRQAELFVLSSQNFDRIVAATPPEAWDKVSPATPEWTVAQLVAHVAQNNLTLTAILNGETVPDAQDGSARYDAAAFAETAAAAEAIAGSQTDPNDTVNGPLGETSVGNLLLLQTADRTVHAWDLAAASGVEAELDPGVVQAAYDFLREHAEEARGAGLFSAEVPVGADATLTERLIALTGRDPGYEHTEPNSPDERAQEIHRS